MILAPSLLSSNFYNLKDDLEILKEKKIKYLHLDVMDGMFVPNISFGMPVIKSISEKEKNNFIFDTHLMIERPERYIREFKQSGADILTIHAEATINYVEVLSYIKSEGMKAGISINPETDIKNIEEALPIADLVLIMSVHPGFGGQKFIDSALEKIRFLSNEKKKKGFKYLIEIDGGINLTNIKEIVDAGAELIVAGSSVFNGDISKNVDALLNACEGI